VRRPLGFSLVELLAALTLLGLVAMLGFPAAADRLAASRASAAAREMALLLQSLRWRAVASSASHGVLFVQDGSGWSWLLVRDANGNGLSTAEVRSGIDLTLSGPQRFDDVVGGIGPGFPPARRIPNVPPRAGTIANLADPVQFGASNLVSFSPLGSASSGTLYLTDGRHALRAVVLFGPTGRVRVWRLDTREGRWRL
jgi:prepilin-type N-terminal cleavage/methylation domain-containing protein